MTILISVLVGIFTYYVAYYVIRLTYRVKYLETVPILGLYVSCYVTQKKTKTLAWLALGATVISRVLYLGRLIIFKKGWIIDIFKKLQ